MEGRVPPASAVATDDDPPLSSPSPLLPPPPSFDKSETYIVQIPRDQIYRVPPPENARIVESYRKPNQKKEKCGGKRCLWILIALVVLAVIVGSIVAVVNVFFSPKAPEFTITKVLARKPPISLHKNAKTSFEISLKAHNPNERMGVSYEDGGETSLSFKQKKIAGGKYPSISQDAKDATTVHLTLAAGSNAGLPKEVEKSLNGTTSKTPVSLSLTIDVPIKLKGLVTLSKDMTVTCDFKVSTLAPSAKVSSQNCETKF